VGIHHPIESQIKIPAAAAVFHNIIRGLNGDEGWLDEQPTCRRFDPGGSLDRRVNCRRVSQPRWVGARRSTKGGKKGRHAEKGKLAAFVLSCAQVGCACSRGLQASAWERARDFTRRPVPPRGQPSRTRVEMAMGTRYPKLGGFLLY
jgi:hypothetical protein